MGQSESDVFAVRRAAKDIGSDFLLVWEEVMLRWRPEPDTLGVLFAMGSGVRLEILLGKASCVSMQMTMAVIRAVGAALGVVLTCTATLGSVARAESPATQVAVLELDPGRTQIDFSLQGTLHTVSGRFALKRGVVRVDPGTGEVDGIVIVDAASGNSGNHSRDAAMRDDVLETGRYPEIRFVPRHFDGVVVSQSEFPLTVRGSLFLHGAEHQVTWMLTVRRDGDKVTISSHFGIPYVAWGLKDPSMFILRVADTVEVNVKSVGHLSD